MKTAWELLKKFFSGTFQTIASIASIVGLVVYFFTSSAALLIAISIFTLFLITILVRFFFITKSLILQETEKGYRKFATYTRYVTTDGEHIKYQIHKYIQCKSFIMKDYTHKFKWSGTVYPLISSQQQDFVESIRKPKGEYDQAIFFFKQPLLYNQFSIMQINMHLDDADGKASKHMSESVQQPLQLLSFRVELLHLEYHKDAKVMRRKRDTPMPQDYEIIQYISFDKFTRSFEYVEFEPKVGYDYKIDWN